MEYRINELSRLAGVSSRTLRYYDSIGLLKPSRVNDAGYRFYSEHEVALLQQILFYRERKLSLDVISRAINQPDFDLQTALEGHLETLKEEQEHISRLIETVQLTLADLKGEYRMADKEKFAAFKKKLIDDNEQKYGKEAREKYGDKAVDDSNRKMLGLSEEEYSRFEQLGEEILTTLEKCVENSADPHGEDGKQMAQLHKEWLMYTWKEYSPQAHVGLAQMYVYDERFTAFYDRKIKGCAEFLNEAIGFWAEKM